MLKIFDTQNISLPCVILPYTLQYFNLPYFYDNENCCWVSDSTKCWDLTAYNAQP